MGVSKKNFEDERNRKNKSMMNFYNTARVHRGNQAFNDIINLVAMFPNNADLGQKVREYVASADNK
jgi:hypothetical protein